MAQNCGQWKSVWKRFQNLSETVSGDAMNETGWCVFVLLGEARCWASRAWSEDLKCVARVKNYEV